jgi:beta-lactamase superfamily II metal-dependent hydrolase
VSKSRTLSLAFLPLFGILLCSCNIWTPFSSSAKASSSITPSVSSSTSSSVSSSSVPSVLTSDSAGDSDPISFHFLELGNAKTGDCTYIKAGENDILIDAGSYYDSYASISSAINQYCTDGKLEYVICTHAHMDHMAGFTHNSAKSTDTSGNGIFYNYKIGTIIDFAQTKSSTAIYSYYQYGRAYAVSQGAVHYTAYQCTQESDGAKKSYSLGKNLSLNILYTDFYAAASSDENDNSVCVLFSQGDSAHFLFTGDLEEDGETSLLKNNPSLPKVKLFKGAHHGSYTATSSALTAVIQPEMVAVCCCAGNQQYTDGADHVFPTQDFINHVAPYTKAIYITTLGSFSDKSVFSSFNGQINIAYNAGVPTVACSNNNTILPLSEWFNKKGDLYDANTPNRVWPSNGVPL